MIPILMYHSLSTDADRRFRRWTVAPAQFAAHLAYLADAGYTTITVTERRAILAGEAAAPPRPLALTFDDGFADFYTVALPLLAARRMTATLYLVTGYMGGTSKWLSREGEGDRPMLTWPQVREIAAAGIELGAHTHTHPPLDVLPAAAVTDEITRSRRVIADETGILPVSFAYPYGYYSAANRRAVRGAGYRSACAVKYAMSGPDDDPFALSRLIVTADTTRAAFPALLTTRTSRVARAVERARAKVWRAARAVGQVGRRRGTQ